MELHHRLSQPNGLAELIVGSSFLFIALLLNDSQSLDSIWTSFACIVLVLFALGALQIEDQRGAIWVSIGGLGLGMLTLGITDNPLLGPVCAISFLFTQYYAVRRNWIGMAGSVSIVLATFLIWEPLGSHSSIGSKILVLSIGLVLSALFASLRLLLLKSEENHRLSVELVRNQARREVQDSLHNNVAASLTRIVMSSEDPAVQEEARTAMRSLRSVFSTDEHNDVLVEFPRVLVQEIKQLRKLGFTAKVQESKGSSSKALVNSKYKQVVRECCTNVIKYGTSPVNVSYEIEESMVRFTLVNKLKPEHDDGDSSQYGLASVATLVRSSGGEFLASQSKESFRVVVEYPAVRKI